MVLIIITMIIIMVIMAILTSPMKRGQNLDQMDPDLHFAEDLDQDMSVVELVVELYPLELELELLLRLTSTNLEEVKTC